MHSTNEHCSYIILLLTVILEKTIILFYHEIGIYHENTILIFTKFPLLNSLIQYHDEVKQSISECSEYCS